jgi:hypothetical protein
MAWLISASLAGSAQDNNTPPLNARTQSGYWVIESNIHTPKTNIVYIYNDFDSLVYSGKMEGRRINTRRKAIKRKLNKKVEQTLWASSLKFKENYPLVKTVLKNKE